MTVAHKLYANLLTLKGTRSLWVQCKQIYSQSQLGLFCNPSIHSANQTEKNLAHRRHRTIQTG